MPLRRAARLTTIMRLPSGAMVAAASIHTCGMDGKAAKPTLAKARPLRVIDDGDDVMIPTP